MWRRSVSACRSCNVLRLEADRRAMGLPVGSGGRFGTCQGRIKAMVAIQAKRKQQMWCRQCRNHLTGYMQIWSEAVVTWEMCNYLCRPREPRSKLLASPTGHRKLGLVAWCLKEIQMNHGNRNFPAFDLRALQLFRLHLLPIVLCGEVLA